MSNLRLQFGMVITTIVMFILMLVLNEWLFRNLEFVPGINWVYLPAGMRLLCTLLFGEAGAIGLLLVSWLVSFFYFFPNDFSRACVHGRHRGNSRSLPGLSACAANFGLRVAYQSDAEAALLCVVAYAVASPLLHHIWFALHGDSSNLVQGFLVMFAGDLSGTLIVIYAIKGLLLLMPTRKTLMQMAGK